MGRVNDGMKQE